MTLIINGLLVLRFTVRRSSPQLPHGRIGTVLVVYMEISLIFRVKFPSLEAVNKAPGSYPRIPIAS